MAAFYYEVSDDAAAPPPLSPWELQNDAQRHKLWTAASLRLAELGSQFAPSDVGHWRGHQYGDGFMSLLLAGLSHFSRLGGGPTEIKIAESEVGPAGASYLIWGLARTRVRRLSFEEADLGDECVKQLGEALGSGCARQLQALTLRSVLLADAGAVQLAAALNNHSNCVLVSLDLSDNSIGPEGAKAMAEALRGGCALETLCLHENLIGDVGAVAIAAAIRTPKCAALRELILSNNEIRAIGGVALARALESLSCCVIALNLSGNFISRTTYEAVAQAQAENHTKPARRLIAARQRLYLGALLSIASSTGGTRWLAPGPCGRWVAGLLEQLGEPQVLALVGELLLVRSQQEATSLASPAVWLRVTAEEQSESEANAAIQGSHGDMQAV